jgi:hypothetical protein
MFQHSFDFDPTVVPPGQFAIANTLAAPGCEVLVQPAGHFGYPAGAETERRLWERTMKLFQAGQG